MKIVICFVNSDVKRTGSSPIEINFFAIGIIYIFSIFAEISLNFLKTSISYDRLNFSVHANAEND